MKKEKLAEHNKTHVQRVMKKFESSQSACVVSPTGTGKSFVVAGIIKELLMRNDKDLTFSVLIIGPTIYVLDQVISTINSVIPKNSNIIIDTVTYTKLSVARDCEEDDYVFNDYDFIVLDELHRSGANEWYKGVRCLLDRNPDSQVLGTTATPIRYLDNNRDMCLELFGEEPTSELTLEDAWNKHLLPVPIYLFGLYTSASKVVSELVKNSEAIDPKLMSKLKQMEISWDSTYNVPSIIKKCFFSYKKTIVFCNSIDEINDCQNKIRNWFTEAGLGVGKFYKCYHGYPNSKSEVYEFCKCKSLDCTAFLFSVDLLNEGVHIPGVDSVIFMRVTGSKRIFLQQMGRCLSHGATKKPLVLDLVSNFDRQDIIKDRIISKISEHNTKNESLSVSDPEELEIIKCSINLYADRLSFSELCSRVSVRDDVYEKFEQFEKFVLLNKRLPKRNASNKEEVQISRWFKRMRTERRGKYPDIAEKLDEYYDKYKSSLSIKSSHRPVHERFEEFEKFVSLNKRLPKRNASNKEEKLMYNWFCTRTRCRGKYPDIVEKLDEYYDKYRSSRPVHEKFEEFEKFVSLNKRLPRPSNKEEKLMYNWFSDMRTRCRGKYPDIVEKLDEYYDKYKSSLSIKSSRRPVHERFEEFEKFVLLNKRLPIESNKEEKLMYYWLSRMRTRCSRSKYPDIVEKLDEYYDKYSRISRRPVHERFEEFEKFVCLNKRLPIESNKEGMLMYRWLRRMRTRCRSKYPDIVEKLDEYYDKYSRISRRRGHEKFEEFEKFVSLNKRLPKRNASNKEEAQLSIWFCDMRTKRRRDKYLDIVEKLDEYYDKYKSSLSIKSSHRPVHERFEEFEKFVSLNKRLPKRNASNKEEARLYSWFCDMRTKRRRDKYLDIAEKLDEYYDKYRNYERLK